MWGVARVRATGSMSSPPIASLMPGRMRRSARWSRSSGVPTSTIAVSSTLYYTFHGLEWERGLTRTTGPCWEEEQVQKDNPKAVSKFLDGCPNPLAITPTKWVGHAGCKLWYDCSGLNTKAECNSNGPLCVWEKNVCVEDMALVLTFHFELFLVKCLADKCTMISAKRMDSIALSLEKAEFPYREWTSFVKIFFLFEWFFAFVKYPNICALKSFPSF